MGNKNVTPKDELEKRRKELLKYRERAKGKILRMGKAKRGAWIRGTKYDPIGKMDVHRMNSIQLSAEITRLQSFTKDKNVYYYEGSSGAIIDGRYKQELDDAIKEYNQSIREYKKTVSRIRMPWAGEVTAGEWDRHFRSKKSYLQGQAFFDMQELTIPKTLKGFKNVEAVRKRARTLRDAASLEGRQKRLRNIKFQIGEMADRIGDDSLKDMIAGLTDEQLFFAWTANGSLANSFSLMYEAMMAKLDGRFNRGRQSDWDNGRDEIAQIVKAIHDDDRVKINLERVAEFLGSGSKSKRKRRKR